MTACGGRPACRPGRRARAPAVAALLIALAAAAGACHPSPHLAISPPPAAPNPALAALQHDLDAILAAPALDRGYWGVLVTSLTTGETLFARNARKLMMPASNMKIVTLAAAAERLGWDYTYATTLFAVGDIGSDVLDGDLLVVGSGDPSLTDAAAQPLFASWAERLRAMGVSAITGRIVGDDRAFEDEPLGMGWSWDDLGDGYAAGVGALQFNEDMVRVTVAPGAQVGDPAIVTTAPASSTLVIRNHLVTAATAATETPLQMHRLPGSDRLDLFGSVAIGSAPAVHTVSVDKPAMFFVASLRRALIDHGIDVRGPAVDVHDLTDAPRREDGVLLVSYRSAPLSTLAVRLMKASQNQYAETLLRTVGAVAGAPTAASGAAATEAVLAGWGLDEGGLIQRDGSGLSRYNYVTPEALVGILTHVDRDARLRDPFEASLPIAGTDGTLANRMKGTAAEGRARVKSGSMANVRAMSGYVTTEGGERLVFSILANNFEAPPETIVEAEEAIVVRLAQFTRSAPEPRNQGLVRK
jgi:serine-type D-Ala-D-Ala carboxypeptidase/endopeptidase (penicillin-binding protein 4)